MKYFARELDHIERWGYLRRDLFRNEEPRIKLVGMTAPTEEMVAQGISTETLPAYTARQSHESEGTREDDLRLNKKLISWGHHTCLEAVQFVYYVTGISKSLAGQWTRHRIGIGWTFRSTRYVKANKNMFIYPALEYIDSEDQVKAVYQAYDREHRHAMDVYDELQKLGVRNQELRRLMPVGWSTAAYVYVNARSLRHFFGLRLEKSAEWEIRRMAYLMYNDAMDIAPTLFEDLMHEEARK
ncbi:MAG TPA: FAD-dependent thymidylate synthase [Desulfomonilia bacterium]|nr:FAD-dependent thymidylate synthase [Thermodesulfobacteriota bacterium]HWR68992.1 FAD-dependent thymidylate synthase [Desulfomonilia bacterium]